jgi:hypothetical protein
MIVQREAGEARSASKHNEGDDLKKIIANREQEILDLNTELLNEVRDKVRITKNFDKETIKKETEIDRLHLVISSMGDEAEKLRKSNIVKANIIATKEEIILRLRGLLYEILSKDNKDADYIDDIFDNNFDEYEDEIIDAYDLNFSASSSIDDITKCNLSISVSFLFVSLSKVFVILTLSRTSFKSSVFRSNIS